MPMTHIPEIGAENRHRLCFKVRQTYIDSRPFSFKASGAYGMPFGTEYFRYRFLVPNRTVLYFHAGLWYRFSGTGFWRRFVVCVSLLTLYWSTRLTRLQEASTAAFCSGQLSDEIGRNAGIAFWNRTFV